MLTLLSMLLFLVGCTSDKTVESKAIFPDDIPDFVQVSDFEKINWEKKPWNLVTEESLEMKTNQVL